jgi:AacA4 family aminoglycoside N(6')-acetyltransferase
VIERSQNQTRKTYNDVMEDILSARVSLRLMTDDDLPLLHTWLNRPHIVEWWGGGRPTMDEIRAHYTPRLMDEAGVTPYIAMLGEHPFAYAQSYVVLGSGGGWWEDETDPGVRGIDQSIGEAYLLGQGLGTKLVRTLVETLLQDPSVTKVQTDPAPTNLRAIRCYERAGFRIEKHIVTPDGPAVYMTQYRQQPRQARGAD